MLVSMKSCFFIALIFAALASLGPARADGPARNRVCLSPAETRDAVAAHKLTEPFAALRSASRLVKADPLRSRLCRWDDEYVYEMTLLPKDGKVVVVFMDAAAGRVVAGVDGKAPPAPPPAASAPIADR
jgi:hypothetical protein